ncbi:DJ-1/PfpI family protein [Paenibacillus sacheonensis]|uniref:DJ-1/PfpI family protein n=1 Tax=Paenibacillus sacheonensis TaxID=742054 RepID=A0A7X4YTQ3_9BACL|nr:DJ-1/PfpI family protein [Paenibacillus sacheonensis]MBM7568582.1 cyclohexyl-isocyanide hydratase [Paenibacillus sacheonensis]NBC72402.1 DJ-1/PfpI family protein [Paenibacillus sacheonensis]
MRIAFILFHGVTFLDFVGFYDVINRLKYFEATKDTTWDICAMSETVADELGMTINANRVKPDLSEYDMIFVPGGMGTRPLRYDEAFVSWLRGAANARYIVSVCTGALLLGAAGYLRQSKATTHPYAYELLEPYASEVIQTRIVHDGNVITAGGVATSIDLGLYVAGLFLTADEVERIKKQMDYPYTPEGILIV